MFGETLGRRAEIGRIPRLRVHATPPAVLGAAEVERVVAALSTPRQRAFVMTLYGAGLRISEAAALCVEDIDSARMQLHVREGKGGRERYVPLSQRLLVELRAYWKRYRPTGPLLFPGRDRDGRLARATISKALRKAARKAGITKRATPHVFRHSLPRICSSSAPICAPSRSCSATRAFAAPPATCTFHTRALLV
jgi:integrase